MCILAPLHFYFIPIHNVLMYMCTCCTLPTLLVPPGFLTVVGNLHDIHLVFSLLLEIFTSSTPMPRKGNRIREIPAIVINRVLDRSDTRLQRWALSAPNCRLLGRPCPQSGALLRRCPCFSTSSSSNLSIRSTRLGPHTHLFGRSQQISRMLVPTHPASFVLLT